MFVLVSLVPGVLTARGLQAQGEIRGRVADSVSGRPINAASITVRRDSAFAGGALVREDGSFRVEGLAPGTYVVRVRAIGYAELVRTGLVIAAATPVRDLGTLGMRTVAVRLASQRVVAEREATVVQPDRMAYSARNMTAASGGTAVDVLRNIPQVEVDGSNTVSLRGNQNVVVQINGRAVSLRGEQLGTFLAQMPAHAIKTVEVATSPAAKDDPEGTAGIINIVLDQEATVGLSGGVLAGMSTTGQRNASGNVGQERGRLTYYLSLGATVDRRESWGNIARENLFSDAPRFVETALSGTQRLGSVNGNGRAEYRLDDRNAVTLDAYGSAGHLDGGNASAYENLDGQRETIGAYIQQNSTDSRSPYLDVDAAFRRLDEAARPQVTAEIEYVRNYAGSAVDLSGGTPTAQQSLALLERDRNAIRKNDGSAKVDYTRRFGPEAKLETGARYLDRSSGVDFSVQTLDAPSGALQQDPRRASLLRYREHIGSGYALFSRKLGSLQAQGGLRLEDARTLLDLPSTAQHVDRHYSSAYPSGVLSYTLSDAWTVRASYSRRVSRPAPYQLNPIEYRQDMRNVVRGNPGLTAEYTDAVDFGIQNIHPWGSVQINPFLKHTTHGLRDIQYVDSAGRSVSTFANLASNVQAGSDVNVNWRGDALTAALAGSISYYRSNAGNLAAIVAVGDPSLATVWWNVRGNATWKFAPLLDAQLSTYYRPPRRTESSTTLALVGVGMGVRYKRWGDQGNITLRISDPFKWQKSGYRAANGTVIEVSERYNGTRTVYLTITRNFGQALKLRPRPDPEGEVAPTSTP